MRISDWSSDVCSSDLRNALRYLHPVSIGVLCRNDREFGSRTCANALDMPLQLQVRIGVQLDLRGLVHLHVVKLRFLEIRFDPAFLVGHDADGGKAGDHHLTDLQSVRLADRKSTRLNSSQ